MITPQPVPKKPDTKPPSVPVNKTTKKLKSVSAIKELAPNIFPPHVDNNSNEAKILVSGSYLRKAFKKTAKQTPT